MERLLQISITKYISDDYLRIEYYHK